MSKKFVDFERSKHMRIEDNDYNSARWHSNNYSPWRDSSRLSNNLDIQCTTQQSPLSNKTELPKIKRLPSILSAAEEKTLKAKWLKTYEIMNKLKTDKENVRKTKNEKS